eukprot:589882-Amphidinium_carterae.1
MTRRNMEKVLNQHQPSCFSESGWQQPEGPPRPPETLRRIGSSSSGRSCKLLTLLQEGTPLSSQTSMPTVLLAFPQFPLGRGMGCHVSRDATFNLRHLLRHSQAVVPLIF